MTEDDPVIRMLHSYYFARPLGTLVERKFGKGRIILCAMDLFSGRIEADYLLEQICRYTLNEGKPDCPELGGSSLKKVISAGQASFIE